jgi:hypothetical protein
MTDTMTSQNIDLSSWDILYNPELLKLSSQQLQFLTHWYLRSRDSSVSIVTRSGVGRSVNSSVILERGRDFSRLQCGVRSPVPYSLIGPKGVTEFFYFMRRADVAYICKPPNPASDIACIKVSFRTALMIPTNSTKRRERVSRKAAYPRRPDHHSDTSRSPMLAVTDRKRSLSRFPIVCLLHCS